MGCQLFVDRSVRIVVSGYAERRSYDEIMACKDILVLAPLEVTAGRCSELDRCDKPHRTMVNGSGPI